METLLFIFYLLLFAFIITVIPFFKNSGLGKPVLIGLFYIKILAGIAYAKFYTLPKYFPTSDTWRYYKQSLIETQWLLQSPIVFLKDLFQYGYTSSGNIFSGRDSYWNDLKSNIPVKMMALFNVFTNNSYYTDIIFFNFLFLFGSVAVYTILNRTFPAKKWLIVFGCFLLPSTLFWCSGIHKDGLIFSAVGMLLYAYFRMSKAGWHLKYLVTIFVSAILIFSLRNYVLFALMPAIFCWWLSEKYPHNKNTIFFSLYLVGIISFFIIPYVFPSINLPGFLVNKQHEFLQLTAGSEVKAPPLQPSLTSFIKFLPHAIDMAFFRPHPTEYKNVSYLPAIVENLVLLLLIMVCVSGIKKEAKISPVILCFFTFAISVLAVCGYTIPFTGAIVRYRSLVLPFLITPLLCIADMPRWKRGKQIRL